MGGYITAEQREKLARFCIEIGRMLGSVISKPGPFLWSLTSDLYLNVGTHGVVGKCHWKLVARYFCETVSK